VLHGGTSTVKIEVVSVEPPLVGELVESWVEPALGFKVTMPNVAWLWPSFLWSMLLVILVLWAVRSVPCLLRIGRVLRAGLRIAIRVDL